MNNQYQDTQSSAGGPLAAISTIARLADFVSGGGPEQIFPRELAGYAATSAVRELLASWTAALSEGSQENLVADVDRVLELLVKFRNLAAGTLPHANGGRDAGDARAAKELFYTQGNTDPYCALSEIRDCLDGLGMPITQTNVESDFVTRSLYFAQVALGKREFFPNVDYEETFGKRIRFTANDIGEPLSVGVVVGRVTVVETTSGGNYRLCVRTDTLAAQGDGFLNKHVYSHEGTVELLDEDPEAPSA
jgi:hypothetical protein